MIEVFTSDFQNRLQAEEIMRRLEKRFEGLKLAYDINESTETYPCGHSILRVEGLSMDVLEIMATVHQTGFRCDILEDKICGAVSDAEGA